MGAVVVSTAMSLDGFVAGPNHEMDWIFDSGFLPDEDAAAGSAGDGSVDELIQTTGAILSGRGSYDVGEASVRTETSSAFGGAWSGPEFVLTHRPPPAGEAGSGVTFLSVTIEQAVATALAAAGERNLLVLGANVAQQCLAADLVDEMVIMVLPVVLGDGIALFAATGGPPVRFETVSVTQYGQAANLRFRRLRP